MADSQKGRDANEKSSGDSWRRYAGMGTELAGALVGLTLAGYWFDRHYGTMPRATLIGAAIGVVGGTYNFIREALALTRATTTSKRDGRVHGADSTDEQPDHTQHDS